MKYDNRDLMVPITVMVVS